MPKNTPRYYAEGEHVYRRDPGNEVTIPKACPVTFVRETLRNCLAYAMDRPESLRLEGDIREAIDAFQGLAVDLMEYPWVGDGPSLIRAGGESILVRIDGNLRDAYWQSMDGSPRWHCDGKKIPWPDVPDLAPTGWRRMPKARR